LAGFPDDDSLREPRRGQQGEMTAPSKLRTARSLVLAVTGCR
jgi:hypothetical protein